MEGFVYVCRGYFLAQIYQYGKILSATLALSCSILLITLSLPIGLFACLLTIAVFLPSFYPYLPTRHTKKYQDKEAVTTLYQCNVCYHNSDKDKLIQQVRDVQPDIICLVEANNDWQGIIDDTLRDDYPYQVTNPPDCQYSSGRVILSRYKITENKTSFVRQTNSYLIQTELTIQGRLTQLLTIHPEACLTWKKFGHQQEDWKNIYAELDELSSDSPLIMCGDFNLTPWHPEMKRLNQDYKLTDTNQTMGLQAAFPTWLRPLPLLLPIDHCLVSSHWQIVYSQRLPTVGSDHLPVLTTLRWRTD
jgi:endonuclease/exonuclease/phosphatase (EEP) superfamily protein YafD